jgi:hypothetical protein
MLWESLSSTFGTQIFHLALRMLRWLLPHPTLRPAASGRVNFVWLSKTASCDFCSKIKSNIYNGCRFEMLATLNAYCHPDSIANAFSSLLSIFNKLQGKNKPVLAFRSRLDGLILEMACCKVVIPPLLLVMLFLPALHSCYLDIV